MMPTASLANSSSLSPQGQGCRSWVARSTQERAELLPQVPTGGHMQEAPVSSLSG